MRKEPAPYDRHEEVRLLVQRLPTIIVLAVVRTGRVRAFLRAGRVVFGVELEPSLIETESRSPSSATPPSIV
jgi:hypothetical protein